MGIFHIGWWSKVIYWKVRHLSSALHVTMWDLRFSQRYFWGFGFSDMWCSVTWWVVPFTLKDIMLSSEWVKRWFPMLWRCCFPSHHCELLSQKHSITPGSSECLLRYACWFQWPRSLNVCSFSGGLASTVGLWVWLPLGPWMCVSIFCDFGCPLQVGELHWALKSYRLSEMDA